MGHYSFLRDLEESKIAVELVKEYIKDSYKAKGMEVQIEELGRKRQSEGDIEIKPPKGKSYTVEIKYDKMAERTGNLCFETGNKKGKVTGVASTTAKRVIYVVPDKRNFDIYFFDTKKLQKYLLSEDNKGRFRTVWGGDRWATQMTLIPKDIVISEKLIYKKDYIDA